MKWTFEARLTTFNNFNLDFNSLYNHSLEWAQVNLSNLKFQLVDCTCSGFKRDLLPLKQT